ncbi:probable LRR receptor-like serine threonine-kinase At4g31250 [Olea europaea subsp. europaea]|uniref:Probable LRR receptor-like serine threonine-kinase At4g31250 n=1 Tax=Olea europaea subsp. europaea TaxID=158383 RepID=A0A8S0PYN9_OLEEU|nr:probable LRR receptor-like serine threonine-kinase At4g31250 [Olea europaea subsp. europaea]
MGLGGTINLDTLAQLPTLLTLSIMNNNFGGPFPGDLKKLEKLRGLNLANNRFSGEIPNDVFSGNNLCGEPLDKCGKNSAQKVALIVAIAVAVPLIVIIAASFIFCRRAKPQERKKSTEIYKKKELSNSKGEITKDNEQGDLYFVRNDRERFELEELLRASSEVLGIGSFGSSYKAVLFSGQRLVVKRFKEMSSLRKEEFYKHMRRLLRLSHPNLLPLVAFYYTKEEKLLIAEFAEQGSLASLLHSK